MAELDARRIASVALAIIDRDGMAGFTMRAVAGELGVTPMALYHHVRNKAELAALVVNAANAEQPLTPVTGDWREDIWQVARAGRLSMLSHPRVAELRRAYRIWTSDVLRKTEQWMSLWLQSGLARDRAVLAATASSVAILGLVESESMAEDIGGRLDPNLFAATPNARMLLSAQFDREALFELAVRAIVDGLYARLSTEAP